eukprot:m.47250 g.47250  ORF g.47250 m.47250 type:complete len:796 (-) comp20448_c1_seq1:160-2547(-)
MSSHHTFPARTSLVALLMVCMIGNTIASSNSGSQTAGDAVPLPKLETDIITSCDGDLDTQSLDTRRAANAPESSFNIVLAISSGTRVSTRILDRLQEFVNYVFLQSQHNPKVRLIGYQCAPTTTLSSVVVDHGFSADPAQVIHWLQAVATTDVEEQTQSQCGPLCVAKATENVLGVVLLDLNELSISHTHVVVLPPAPYKPSATNEQSAHISSEQYNDLKQSIITQVTKLNENSSISIDIYSGKTSPACEPYRLGNRYCANVYSDGRGFNKGLTAACLTKKNQASTLQAGILNVGVSIKVESISKALMNTTLETSLQCALEQFGIELTTTTTTKLTTPELEDVEEDNARTLEPKDWKGAFVDKAIQIGTPNVFSNTVVKTWNASSWTSLRDIQDFIGEVEFVNVKTSKSGKTMDADLTAEMMSLLTDEGDIELDYTVSNMSSTTFFEGVLGETQATNGDGGDGVDNGNSNKFSHFMDVPDSIKVQFQPNQDIFWTEKDSKLQKQFLWLSSAGTVTNTHFDQDHNIFVQLVGKKRFTLFPASAHRRMHSYPRLHPLWHKSQVNIENPDFVKFGDYPKQSERWVVTVGPGDALYIPPYTWHNVETLEPSLSLSTLSHDDTVRKGMKFVYSMDHKFDLVVHPMGKIFALRLYLDMMIKHIYGEDDKGVTRFFTRLVSERYEQLRHRFTSTPEGTSAAGCFHAKAPEGKILTAGHVYMDCLADLKIVAASFKNLKPEVRDIIFQDYVEELTAQVVGVEHVLTFYEQCFQGQTYEATQASDELHDELWRYYDEELDGELT